MTESSYSYSPLSDAIVPRGVVASSSPPLPHLGDGHAGGDDRHHHLDVVVPAHDLRVGLGRRNSLGNARVRALGGLLGTLLVLHEGTVRDAARDRRRWHLVLLVLVLDRIRAAGSGGMVFRRPRRIVRVGGIDVLVVLVPYVEFQRTDGGSALPVQHVRVEARAVAADLERPPSRHPIEVLAPERHLDVPVRHVAVIVDVAILSECRTRINRYDGRERPPLGIGIAHEQSDTVLGIIHIETPDETGGVGGGVVRVGRRTDGECHDDGFVLEVYAPVHCEGRLGGGDGGELGLHLHIDGIGIVPASGRRRSDGGDGRGATPQLLLLLRLLFLDRRGGRRRHRRGIVAIISSVATEEGRAPVSEVGAGDGRDADDGEEGERFDGYLEKHDGRRRCCFLLG